MGQVQQPLQLVNEISGITGIHILPFMIVAILWGSTDVLIARASVQPKQEFEPMDFSPMKLMKLILSRRIWIWMGINQVGSLLYAYLLGIYPEQYSLIWANCLTVLVSFVLEKVFNSKKQDKQAEDNKIQRSTIRESTFDGKLFSVKGGRKDIQNLIGVIFVLLGIYLMLI